MHYFSSPPRRTASERGETSILFTFFVLAIIVLTALVIATLVIVTLRNTRDISSSTQAFYAADSGNERGLYTFYWSLLGQNGNPNCSTNNTQEPLDTRNAYQYTIQMEGKRDDGNTGCPDIDKLSQPGNALCMRILGEATTGGAKRVLRNDSDKAECLDVF